MSRQVMEVLFLYQAIKCRFIILYLVSNKSNITDDIFDKIFNSACKDVANHLNITESSVRDKFSRKAGVNTPTAKQAIKDYLFNKTNYFEVLISRLITKKDNPNRVLLVLKSI